MLTRIHIQNFAISSEAEVELSAGMSVLTGETGAGKSILIDALNLALGDRADAGVVRAGCDKAVINVSFAVAADSPAKVWLAAHGLDAGDECGDECHVRRVIAAEGRSKAFINNGPATLVALRELGETLVEIHGQHEHQGLTRPARQRQMLDASGDHGELVDAVAQTAAQYKAVAAELDAVSKQVAENTAQLELLRYQIGELQGLDIENMDIGALLREQERLSHAEDLREVGWQSAQQLKHADDVSISQQIGRLMSAMQPWHSHSAEIAAVIEMLGDMNSLADEAARQMEKLRESLNADPQRASQLDELITELHTLSRKHGVAMQALPQCYRDKKNQLAAIDRSGADLGRLRAQKDELHTRYMEQTARLHEKRKQSAAALSARVTENMQLLGMKGGKFSVAVGLDEGADADATVAAHGRDHVRFMVSANPGQPLLPLAKVASGGELSRISLAVTVVCAAANAAPSMIFDEVDSGIGGAVAEIVGRQLRSLSKSRQVLCVTHLPQVAALGHHHFRVVKTSAEKQTHSRVFALDEKGREQELARMLGGVEITASSLAHARQLRAADGVTAD